MNVFHNSEPAAYEGHEPLTGVLVTIPNCQRYSRIAFDDNGNVHLIDVSDEEVKLMHLDEVNNGN